MPNRFLKGSGNVFPLLINETNLVSSPSNNVYQYDFPNGSVNFQNCSVAVQSIQMYNSWYNITAARGNNSFSFIHPVAAGYNTVNLTIPDGNYSLPQLNAFLLDYLIDNNYYLVNPAGDIVVYLQLIENPTFYKIQFNSFLVPTALPGGWSDPSGLFSFPLVSETPQLIVPNTLFTELIGFNAGTYPAAPSITDYTKLSDFTPQISPVSSIILNCNLAENYYANPQTSLCSFSAAGVVFGGLIDYAPSEFSFIKIQDGSFFNIRIEFTDQVYRPLNIRDTSLCIVLLIRHDED
jgi:hypothetical protein